MKGKEFLEVEYNSGTCRVFKWQLSNFSCALHYDENVDARLFYDQFFGSYQNLESII